MFLFMTTLITIWSFEVFIFYLKHNQKWIKKQIKKKYVLFIIIIIYLFIYYYFLDNSEN